MAVPAADAPTKGDRRQPQRHRRRGRAEAGQQLLPLRPADAQAVGVLAAGMPAKTARDLLLGALKSAGLTGRPPPETAATAEPLVMLPSARP